LNTEITSGCEVNLEKLAQVLTKCQSIEALKFFQVNITKGLVKIIAEKCPNLKYLELNPVEPWDWWEFELTCLDEVKLLVQNCQQLENFVFRAPRQNIVDFMTENGFGYDKIDRNFFFYSGQAAYGGKEHGSWQMDHHNLHMAGENPHEGEIGNAVGLFHPAGAGPQDDCFLYIARFRL